MQQGIFYIHFPRDRTAHTRAFDGPVVNRWLEQKIAQTANASALLDRLRYTEGSKPLQLSALLPELHPIQSMIISEIPI